MTDKLFEKSQLFKKSTDFLLEAGKEKFYLYQLTRGIDLCNGTAHKFKNKLIEWEIIKLAICGKREKYYVVTSKGDKIFRELAIIKEIMGW